MAGSVATAGLVGQAEPVNRWVDSFAARGDEGNEGNEGNSVDRVQTGHFANLLDFHRRSLNGPSFNRADIFIVLAALTCWDSLKAALHPQRRIPLKAQCA